MLKINEKNLSRSLISNNFQAQKLYRADIFTVV